MRRSTRAIRAVVVVLAAAGLTLDACIGELSERGDVDSDEAEVIEDAASDTELEEGEDAEDADDAEPDEPEEPQETQAGDSAANPVSGGTDPVPESDLPGEDASLYFSGEGEWVDVVGVDHAEVLLARGLPGPDAAEVGQVAPMEKVTLAGRERLVATGDAENVEDAEVEDLSAWVEVDLSDGVGWVERYHLGFIDVLSGADSLSQYEGYGTHPEPIGAVSEVAQARAEELTEAGSSPVVPVLVDGRDGTQLMQTRTVEQPITDAVQARAVPVAPEEGVVQVRPALGGPDPEYVWTVDFLGFGDDSVRGERVEFIVFDVDNGYEVVGAWKWDICGRGVTQDGECV